MSFKTAPAILEILDELADAVRAHPQAALLPPSFDAVLARAADAAAEYRVSNCLKPSAIKAGTAREYISSLHAPDDETRNTALLLAHHILELDGGYSAAEARAPLAALINTSNLTSTRDAYIRVASAAVEALRQRADSVRAATQHVAGPATRTVSDVAHALVQCVNAVGAVASAAARAEAAAGSRRRRELADPDGDSRVVCIGEDVDDDEVVGYGTDGGFFIHHSGTALGRKGKARRRAIKDQRLLSEATIPTVKPVRIGGSVVKRLPVQATSWASVIRSAITDGTAAAAAAEAAAVDASTGLTRKGQKKGGTFAAAAAAATSDDAAERGRRACPLDAMACGRHHAPGDCSRSSSRSATTSSSVATGKAAKAVGQKGIVDNAHPHPSFAAAAAEAPWYSRTPLSISAIQHAAAESALAAGATSPQAIGATNPTASTPLQVTRNKPGAAPKAQRGGSATPPGARVSSSSSSPVSVLGDSARNLAKAESKDKSKDRKGSAAGTDAADAKATGIKENNDKGDASKAKGKLRGLGCAESVNRWESEGGPSGASACRSPTGPEDVQIVAAPQQNDAATAAPQSDAASAGICVDVYVDADAYDVDVATVRARAGDMSGVRATLKRLQGDCILPYGNVIAAAVSAAAGPAAIVDAAKVATSYDDDAVVVAIAPAAAANSGAKGGASPPKVAAATAAASCPAAGDPSKCPATAGSDATCGAPPEAFSGAPLAVRATRASAGTVLRGLRAGLMEVRRSHADAVTLGEGLMRLLFTLDELTGMSESGRAARKTIVHETQTLLVDVDCVAARLGARAIAAEAAVGHAKEAVAAHATKWRAAARASAGLPPKDYGRGGARATVCDDDDDAVCSGCSSCDECNSYDPGTAAGRGLTSSFPPTPSKGAARAAALAAAAATAEDLHHADAHHTRTSEEYELDAAAAAAGIRGKEATDAAAPLRGRRQQANYPPVYNTFGTDFRTANAARAAGVCAPQASPLGATGSASSTTSTDADSKLSPATAAAVERQAQRVLAMVRDVPSAAWLPPASLWLEAEAAVQFRAQQTQRGWAAQAHVPGVDPRTITVDLKDGEDGGKVAVVAFTRVPTARDVQAAAPSVLRTLRDAVLKAATADALAGRCVHGGSRASGSRAHECPFTPDGITHGVLHAAVLEALRGRFGRVAEVVPLPAAADADELDAEYERGVILLAAPWRMRRTQELQARAQQLREQMTQQQTAQQQQVRTQRMAQAQYQQQHAEHIQQTRQHNALGALDGGNLFGGRDYFSNIAGGHHFSRL